LPREEENEITECDFILLHYFIKRLILIIFAERRGKEITGWDFIFLLVQSESGLASR
jgi:hypothetical protein